MIQTYKKRPVSVQALRWDGTADLAAVIVAWAERYGTKVTHNTEPYEHFELGEVITPNELVIHTLEGNMTAFEGTWIIKGVEDEFYPCIPSVFAATYELED